MIKYRVLFLLCVAGLLVYGNALGNEFVLDDRRQLVLNEAVHSLKHIPELFAGSTFFSGGQEGLSGGFYRPLMMTVYAVIYTVFGPHPWVFHGVQIGWHVVNALLVYLVFKKWLRPFVALFLAMVFLVHPINAETVVYIANLQDILCVFFGLLAVLYMLYRPKLIAQTWVLPGLLFLALLSKETGLVFAVLCGVYARLFEVKGWSWRRVLMVVFVYGLLKANAVGLAVAHSDIIPIATASLGVRLLTAPAIFWHYIATFIYPERLSVMAQWVVRTPALFNFVLPFLSLLVLGGLWYWYGGRLKTNRRSLSQAFDFFTAWLLLGLLPHMQLVPLDATVADRWFYLAGVGLLGMLGVALERWQKNKGMRSFFLVAAGCVLLTLGARTVVRNTNWRSEFVLVSHDAVLDPDNFLLENALGYALMRNGQFPEAEIHLRHSIALVSSWHQSWNNLGYLAELRGDKTEAAAAYERALYWGGSYLTYANYGNLMIEQGQLVTARELLTTGVGRYPKNPRLWFLLKEVYLRLGDRPRAEEAAAQLRNLEQNK